MMEEWNDGRMEGWQGWKIAKMEEWNDGNDGRLVSNPQFYPERSRRAAIRNPLSANQLIC